MSDLVKKLEHLDCMYKRTIAEVRELSVEAENSLAFISAELLLSRFDELLQHILMCTASTLGEYKELDHKIIKGLALKGDFVRGYNDYSKQIGENVVISWESLYKTLSELDIEKRTELQASFSSFIYDRAGFMVKAIAPVSCLHRKNYLFNIVRRLRWTVTAFINATTPDIKEDKLAKAQMARAITDKLFVEAWMHECEQFTEMFLKTNEGLEIARDDLKRISELEALEDCDKENL